MDALTHVLDTAGRGYCCTSNPLEEQAETGGNEKTRSGARQRAAEGAGDEKLSGQ